MRAVDTNLVVRILVRDHPSQADAADDYVAKGAWVSCLVLAEAVWVFESVYGFSRAELAEAVDLLLRHKDLTIQDVEVVVAALKHFRTHRKVEFTDCLVLEIARKAGHSPVATFDKDFAKLEGVERVAGERGAR